VITEQQAQKELSDDMLRDMGNRLHVTMLKMTILFGFLFGVLNFFIGTREEIILALLLVPICGFFLWIYQLGYVLLSKVLSMLAITGIISLVSVLVAPDVLAPVFLVPIIIGTLIIFPGKEQKTGYILATFLFCLLIFLLIGEFQLGPIPERSAEKLYMDRVSNIIGLAILSILEIYFIMRTSRLIQKLLAERSENLRQSNKRLTSLVQSRESMVSILSHDLRSPLTLIVTTLDLLKPGRFPPDQLEGLVEKVSNRTKNTLLMLDSLLLWSRSQSENANLEIIPVSLRQVRLNLINYCELLFAEKQLTCRIDFPDEESILVNPMMLDTLLRNLVSNAFKFTPADGLIVVSARKQDTFWEFLVEDNGRGMKPETLENLRSGITFSTEGTDKEKGHGLGIQIIRDFLAKLGGSLEVESREGKGSKFSFRIPRSA
jgi:signal transduction histidine kinase